MRTKILLAMLSLGVLVTGCATTLPYEPNPPSETPGETPDGTLPEPAPPLGLDQLAAFGGVAMLNAGSNCTGTLIDTGVPAGPAYVLTNGHCVGDVGRSRQTTTLDYDWFGEATFFRAAGNKENTYQAKVVQLAYSTMHQTDTAIVRLAPTLGELQAQGVRAVPIADAEPAGGAPVVNIGVPVQGLDEEDWVLREGECTLGAQHTLLEFGWLWHGVWSNDCPGIIQGSSGSPLFEADATGPVRIVGMINTTSKGIAPGQGGDCWINRPCQVTADAVTMVPDTSYAQSVAGIGRCFDPATGEFATGGDCPLPVSDVWAEESGGWFRGGGEPDGAGRMPQARLVGREAGTVRTALVPLGDGAACQAPATYAAQPQPLPEAGEHSWDPSVGLTLPVELPAAEGHFLLCAVRGDNYAGASGVHFAVDRTPPVVPAGADAERLDDAVIVRPHLDPPELMSVRFTWGPQGQVDCEDTAAFQEFFIVPLTLLAEDLPATYCIYGLDAAGNTTPVERIEIPA